MKTTDKQTQHILLKAWTNSDWDTCDFAIVHLTEDWKREQQKRLEAIRPFAGDCYFQSVNYRDTAVDFYKMDDNDQPDVAKLLGGKNWAFVELDEGELETLSVPENHLECYRLVLYGNGSAMYKAYGECRSEEFWTEEFSLKQIIEQP